MRRFLIQVNVMATREEAKQVRRVKILAATRVLIRDTSVTIFSMRVLAKRAGVSLVTLYNLFGSKQAIMYALLDEDIQQYGGQLSRSRLDPLAILFRAVTLGKTHFEREPDYYKAILFAVYSNGGTEFRTMFRGPRRELWRRLVAEAVEAQCLEEWVDCEAFSVHLATIYFANILEWVAGEISLKDVETRTHYGFALALLGVATQTHTDVLLERITKAQKKL
ncbi:MAG: AcrR family transcriptional regulator [Limisphaerales bacterium]|jgi:AcrR family transcriptional regulator